jgi:hypothetical protein
MHRFCIWWSGCFFTYVEIYWKVWVQELWPDIITIGFTFRINIRFSRMVLSFQIWRHDSTECRHEPISSFHSIYVLGFLISCSFLKSTSLSSLTPTHYIYLTFFLKGSTNLRESSMWIYISVSDFQLANSLHDNGTVIWRTQTYIM